MTSSKDAGTEQAQGWGSGTSLTIRKNVVVSTLKTVVSTQNGQLEVHSP